VADRKPVAPDLRSGPLGYELNGADNGSDAAKVRALVLLKIQLGLFDLPTRKAAELIPTMVREIQEGTVNGRLLRRAIEAERKLNAKEAK
jgi:hypothetical protein